MKISIAFHIVGLIMWLGSLMILTRCLKIFTKEYPKEAKEGINNFRQTVSRIFYAFCIPGLVISLLSGLYQFSANGAAYYMKLGWFHAKLTLVLVLFAVTFLAAKEISFVLKEQVISAGKTTFLHAAASTCMILIIFLTILGR